MAHALLSAVLALAKADMALCIPLPFCNPFPFTSTKQHLVCPVQLPTIHHPPPPPPSPPTNRGHTNIKIAAVGAHATIAISALALSTSTDLFRPLTAARVTDKALTDLWQVRNAASGSASTQPNNLEPNPNLTFYDCLSHLASDPVRYTQQRAIERRAKRAVSL